MKTPINDVNSSEKRNCVIKWVLNEKCPLFVISSWVSFQVQREKCSIEFLILSILSGLFLSFDRILYTVKQAFFQQKCKKSVKISKEPVSTFNNLQICFPSILNVITNNAPFRMNDQFGFFSHVNKDKANSKNFTPNIEFAFPSTKNSKNSYEILFCLPFF